MKIFLLLISVTFAMSLTHCYKTTVFLTFITVIEKVQKWFIKALPDMKYHSCHQRLSRLDPESLELRQLHADMLFMFIYWTFFHHFYSPQSLNLFTMAEASGQDRPQPGHPPLATHFFALWAAYMPGPVLLVHLRPQVLLSYGLWNLFKHFIMLPHLPTLTLIFHRNDT